jgi:hypothetical protein
MLKCICCGRHIFGSHKVRNVITAQGEEIQIHDDIKCLDIWIRSDKLFYNHILK